MRLAAPAFLLIGLIVSALAGCGETAPPPTPIPDASTPVNPPPKGVSGKLATPETGPMKAPIQD